MREQVQWMNAKKGASWLAASNDGSEKFGKQQLILIGNWGTNGWDWPPISIRQSQLLRTCPLANAIQRENLRGGTRKRVGGVCVGGWEGKEIRDM